MARLALLVALALAAVGCGGSESTAVTVEQATVDIEAPPTTATTDAPATSDVEVPLPAGREVIDAAAAAGQPYVLWFWGVN